MTTTSIRLYGTTRRLERIVTELLVLVPDAVLEVITDDPSPLEPDYLRGLKVVLGNAVAAGRRVVLWLASDFYNAKAWSPTTAVLCCNWRRMLTPAEIRSATYGAYVIHDSLLPKYRGFSPLVHAILDGEVVTGATMFVPTKEVDAGPIVGQKPVYIGGMAIAKAMEVITIAYLELIREYIPRIVRGEIPELVPQTGPVSFAPRIDWDTAAEVKLHWPADTIAAHCRAFSYPYPRAYVVINGKREFLT